MVESNNGEERLARIEHMLESLQQESAAIKKVAADVLEVVVRAAPGLAAAAAVSAGRKVKP